MARYLLIDDRDGKMLAELTSPQQAARVLARLARSLGEDPSISVVRLDHQEGSLSDVDSIVSIRLLPPPAAPRANSKRTPDRPPRHPPTPPPELA